MSGVAALEAKELVKRLRAFRPTYGWPEEQATVVKQTLGDEVADALEALVKERDRLKAALETIAEGRDSRRHDGLPEEHPAHDADVMYFIACKALEGEE